MAETRLTLNEAAVKVGGSMPDKDVPNINMGRWAERCFLNANFPVAVPSGARFKSEGDRFSLDAGGYGHVFYPLPDGSLEYELVFDRRPAADSFVFNLTFSEGLSFNFQPALDKDPEVLNNPLVATVTSTEARDAKGKLLYRRPEHIVGSYAVYWKNAGHYRRGDGSTAVNYRTGKFGHIYRPKLIDALGREKWAEMQIVPTSRTTALMAITADKAWLDSATYPVILDPTFGYDTIGGSSGPVGQGEIFASGMGAPAADGTVTAINIYCSTSGNPDVTVGLFTDSSGPSAKVGSENENPNVGNLGADWHAFSTNSLSVSNGINYWPSANSSADITVYYDSAGGTNRYWDNTSYGDPWPSTFSQDSSSGAIYSMYADYTESGTDVVISDTGSGADALAIAVDASVGDTGAGSDDPSVGAEVSESDSGAGADAPSVGMEISESDVGSGTDDPAVEAEVSESDSGSGSEALSLAAFITISDAGAGDDSPSIAVFFSLSDTGGGSDEVAVAAEGDVQIQDSGSGSDSVILACSVSVQDSGEGAGAVLVEVTLPVLEDAGNGLDTVSVLSALAISDSGAGADAASVGPRGISITDVAVGSDVLTISALVDVEDTGQGVEALLVDTGLLAEIIRMLSVQLKQPSLGQVALSRPSMPSVKCSLPKMAGVKITL